MIPARMHMWWLNAICGENRGHPDGETVKTLFIKMLIFLSFVLVITLFYSFYNEIGFFIWDHRSDVVSYFFFLYYLVSWVSSVVNDSEYLPEEGDLDWID